MYRKLSYISCLSLLLILLLNSCGSKGDDISGEMQGVWSSKWDDEIDDLGDMRVDETIAFIDDEDSDSEGMFRQVFVGKVDTDDESVPFVVVASGSWEVVDKDGIKLRYDISNFGTAVFDKGMPYTGQEAALAFMTGDWNEPIKNAIKDIAPSKLNSNLATEVKKGVNSFFKDMFEEINGKDVTMAGVVIRNKSMECTVLPVFMKFFGRDQKFQLADVDVKSLTSVAAPQSNLPNYDWLSTRNATYSDVANLSKAELRIMRNYIFARHGYIFRSPDLAEYFRQYPWYSPQYGDVSYRLNNIENANIRFIQMYE